MSRAILIALRIDREGRRQVLAVEYANRESQSSWKELPLGLEERELNGVRFVMSDDHHRVEDGDPGSAARSVVARCYVPFLRNALDYLPRKQINSLKSTLEIAT